jgi:hypothetical protein
MDELALEKMKLYVAITQNNTATQERQIQVLTDELESCRSFIESLQLDERERVKGVSQFRLEQLKSGGEIVEQTKHQVDKGLNVMLDNSDGFHVCIECCFLNVTRALHPQLVKVQQYQLSQSTLLKLCATYGRGYTRWKKKKPVQSVLNEWIDKKMCETQFVQPLVVAMLLKTQRYFMQLVDLLRFHENYAMSVLMTKQGASQQDVVRKKERKC